MNRLTYMQCVKVLKEMYLSRIVTSRQTTFDRVAISEANLNAHLATLLDKLLLSADPFWDAEEARRDAVGVQGGAS